MGSEITGLDDRHAYLKLGNNVARFDFDYLDLPTPTPGFLQRKHADVGMSFDPDTLEPHPWSFAHLDGEDEEDESQNESALAATQPVSQASTGSAPIAYTRKPRPIRWPNDEENEPARARGTNWPTAAAATAVSTSQTEPKTQQQLLFANDTVNPEGPSFELRP
jgi:hypothetical protein